MAGGAAVDSVGGWGQQAWDGKGSAALEDGGSMVEAMSRTRVEPVVDSGG